MKTKVCEAKESRKEKRRGKGKKKKKAGWFPAWTCPQIDLHPPGGIVLIVPRKTHVAHIQTTPVILFNYHSSSSDLH